MISIVDFFKGKERSEYSYIGLADFLFVFFQEKSSNLLQLNFNFLQFDLWFFKFSTFALLKGRKAPISNSKSVKVTKNVIFSYFENGN